MGHEIDLDETKKDLAKLKQIRREVIHNQLFQDLHALFEKYSQDLSSGCFCQEIISFATYLVKQNVSHRVALSVLYDYVNTAYLDKME